MQLKNNLLVIPARILHAIPRAICGLALLLWLQSVPAEQIEIVEWEVSWKQSRPRDPYMDGQSRVWFCGQTGSYLAYLVPDSGDIKKFPTPDEKAGDPHTLVFDGNGDIWFTVQHGNFVGKLTRENGTVRLFPVPTPRARPYGVRVDSSDRPWIALFGTNELMTVDPETYAQECSIYR